MNFAVSTSIYLLVIASLFTPLAAETKSTASDQTNLSLTVYNGGRALVRDSRQINLQQPTQHIAFMDVAELIMPQTVAIDGLTVLEQNYDFDLLSPQSLINKNIGKNVRIARRSNETGETIEWMEGTILSTNSGTIVKMKDGSLESLKSNTSYHMIFNDIPDNLRTTPTLSLLLSKTDQGHKKVELTYLTNGLSWQSDYVLQLDKNETSASLNSWITVKNQSGIQYTNAQLQLLAGDVNMQRTAEVRMMRDIAYSASSRPVTKVTEQALHGYHLYSVPHKTTINNKQSKQIKLFSRSNIPVQKKTQDKAAVNSRGMETQKSKPEQFLIFNNTKPELGLPLPKGTVRVYGNDNSGNKQFIGEDRINHTGINEELEIKLGKAFDLSVERSTRKFRKVSKKQTHLKREVKINNGSKKQQTITIGEIMPVHSWEIKKSTHNYTNKLPSVAEFTLTIPALKKATIEYDLWINYP